MMLQAGDEQANQNPRLPNADLRRIARLARTTASRLRLSRALHAATAVLPLPLCICIIVLAVIKIQALGWAASRPWLIVAALAFLSVIAVAFYELVRKRPRYEGALALDRHYGLHDRLANALSFAALPSSQRTPLMEMAIDDALKHARDLKPRKAAPFSWPRDTLLCLGLLACLTFLSLLEVRTYRIATSAETIDAVNLSADDIDFFRDASKDLSSRDQGPEMRAAIDRFNQLVEDLANERLDRTEAFRRMQALEKDLLKGTAADRKALEDGLSQIADELRRSDLSRPAADALKNKDLAGAEKALRDLAQRLKKGENAANKAELDRLRLALERAGKNNKERLAALEKQRADLASERDSLLRRKREGADAGTSEEDQRLLRKKDRALERLDRDLEQQRAAQRQLDRLERELAQAAADLLRDLGLSASDLDKGAEDVNRMAREQMTEQEREELRKRIQELRELIRQHGQGGKVRMARLQRFSQHARGQRGQGNGGQPGQGDGTEQEGKGQRADQSGGQVWVVGPDGKQILITRGSGSSASSSGGQGSSGAGDRPGGDGQQGGGKSWGTGHDANLAGKATHSKMGTEDAYATGIDTGEGGNRSEVIYGAADRGFVGKKYKQVFTEYHTVAERSMSKEDVPAGYRFYIQRYFQLIRPRD